MASPGRLAALVSCAVWGLLCPRSSGFAIPWQRAGLAELHAAGAVKRSDAACSTDVLQAKDLDLVVYGATGFTGKLSAEYLGGGHPDRPVWAIAGRHLDDLEALEQRLVHKPAAILVGDLANDTALLAITTRARVVLSYAGPYEEYGGEALVNASVWGCAHYVDITGENNWKQIILEKYGAAAEERGVAIVQSSGADSMPSDLLGLASAEALAGDGNGPPGSITVVYSKNNGGWSGGTVASGLYRAAHHRPITDPYFLAPATPQGAKVDSTLGGSESYGFNPTLNATLGAAPSSTIDGPVLRRSMSVAFPGAPIHVVVGQTGEVVQHGREFRQDPRWISDPPPSHPQPGEGPPEWMRRAGSFAASAVAKRAGSPKVARVALEAHADPGYLGTARMSTELALGLALDGPANGRGGYLTPSLALGAQALMDRLGSSLGGKFMNFSTALDASR